MRFSFAQPSMQSFGRRPGGSKEPQHEPPGTPPALDGSRGPAPGRRSPASREAGAEPGARSAADALAPEPPGSPGRGASDETDEHVPTDGIGGERDGPDILGKEISEARNAEKAGRDAERATTGAGQRRRSAEDERARAMRDRLGLDVENADEEAWTDGERDEPGETAAVRSHAQEFAAAGGDQDEEESYEELDDVAVTIGRVVSIRGSVMWGALYDDDAGTTARAARMGALVSMRGPESRVFGVVNALDRDQGSGSQAERTIFEMQVLGEISTVSAAATAAGFQRGVSSYPPLDAPITTVTLRDLATVYARPRASNVHIGRLRHNHKVPAFVLTDSLLGKHFAVLGTTGAGKSCAVTVILRSILDEHPSGHVVLLDPHNEYATAFADKAELLNPSNLQLPYWLLNFEEIAHILIGTGANEYAFAQTAILKDAIQRAKIIFAGENEAGDYITVDTPMPYRLSDLIASLKEGMGQFNKADGAGPYLGLISRIESLRADRRYAFMFASLAVRDNMRQILGQLLRIPVDGKPITIIDISGVPSEIVDVVVSVLFRLVFELAVWSDRGAAPPVLLVCEEAHRYVPQNGSGFAPTKRVISRIAKEGRKYGVTLCLVSQRPSELAIDSLSQCNTVFALRLTNEHDQSFVARALPENARWLVDSLPSLNTQEAVVVGDGVTVPVHIRFKDLDSDNRPSGGDPSFATAWREEADPTFLERAIDRWRHQTR
jgi:uncharacterized protein